MLKYVLCVERKTRSQARISPREESAVIGGLAATSEIALVMRELAASRSLTPEPTQETKIAFV